MGNVEIPEKDDKRIHRAHGPDKDFSIGQSNKPEYLEGKLDSNLPTSSPPELKSLKEIE